jgi:hypothetical protein
MLTDKRILELWENYSPTQGIASFARTIEAEVRKQDEALIRQMLEALKNTHDVGCNQTDAAIAAANKRLNP